MPVYSNAPNLDEIPYGDLKPRGLSRLVLLMVRLALARGLLSRNLRKLWLRVFSSVVDVQVRGVHYRLDISDNVTDAKILLSSKIYDKVELSWLESVCKGGVFVDIGANTGYYSLHMAKLGAKKVLAIEPNPKTLERLRFNLSCNDFSVAVAVLPCAVGPAGTAMLSFDGDLGSASLERNGGSQIDSIEVESRPLLNLIIENGVGCIHGLKVDVEGYEWKALAPFFNLAPNNLLPKVIVIETCHQKYGGEDILSLLKGKGYSVVSVNRSNTILRLEEPLNSSSL